MPVSLQHRIKTFEALIPFINGLVDNHEPTLIYIHVEGLKANTFRSFFSTAISTVLKHYYETENFAKYTVLKDFWNRWGFRSDPKLDSVNTAVLCSKGFLTGAYAEVSYTKGLGFGVLKPCGNAAGAPTMSHRMTQPEISGYDQPYEEDVCRAFLLLKAKERITHSIVLRGITLDEVQSKFDSELSSSPSILVIENDPNSIVIL